jgi:hypothetical protein
MCWKLMVPGSKESTLVVTVVVYGAIVDVVQLFTLRKLFDKVVRKSCSKRCSKKLFVKVVQKSCSIFVMCD